MIKPGDLGLSAKRKGWYPAAVRFFTQSKYSHIFIIADEYYGQIQVIETNLNVTTTSFKKEYEKKNADSFVVFRPIKTTQSEIHDALHYIHGAYSGDTYGFLQVPWFAYRAIMRVFGFKPKYNWFPAGQICSETPLEYLKLIYADAFSHLTPNECSPEDIAKVVEGRPDLFMFVMERK